MATQKTINHDLVAVDYSIMGAIPLRAAQIRRELEAQKPGDKDPKFKFDKLIMCNIGNPQALGNQPLTFPRQVISLLCNPKALSHPDVGKLYPADVVSRATSMLAAYGHTGAYTHPNGTPSTREAIARGINRRDNAGAGRDLSQGGPNTPTGVCAKDIIMTNGASEAIQMLLRLFINNHKDGIMCPVPQYPLYTATIELYGGALVPYYLDEEKGFGVSLSHLEDTFVHATQLGIAPRAMVCINPGNPTGRVYSVSTMTAIIRFCHSHNIPLIADEVYQECVYDASLQWRSFREVALTQGLPVARELQLISLHSISKGCHGECGRRGGYMHLENVPREVFDTLAKLPAMGMCPNIDGQWMTELMMDPPRPGDASYASYAAERQAIWDAFKARADMVSRGLNAIPNISCQKIEGAFYAFARLALPQRFIERALRRGTEPDFAWCWELLENYGVVCIPGSGGFGQVPGTYHFRTTILPPKAMMAEMLNAIKSHHACIWDQHGESAAGQHRSKL